MKIKDLKVGDTGNSHVGWRSYAIESNRSNRYFGYLRMVDV